MIYVSAFVPSSIPEERGPDDPRGPKTLTFEQQMLVEKNLGLVYSIARDMYNQSPLVNRFGEDEAVAAGWYALVQAAIAYRPHQGPFVNLAGVCIRRQIRHEAKQAVSAVNVPAYLFKKSAKKNPEKVRKMENVQRSVYLGALTASGAETMVGPAKEQSPVVDELPPQVVAAISELPDRQQQVLWMRFFGGYTLAAVGELWGVTGEAVRQCEAKSLARLRAKLEGQEGVLRSAA
jgi:RNA polymerase sigma factor (sigma-70 family)